MSKTPRHGAPSTDPSQAPPAQTRLTASAEQAGAIAQDRPAAPAGPTTPGPRSTPGSPTAPRSPALPGPAPHNPQQVAGPASPITPPTSEGTPDTFTSSINPIDSAVAKRMRASYHAGCPVPLTDLRYLTITYLGFDGRPHVGEMVVAARVANDVVTAFAALYAARFPIHRMRLVADFGGSDDAAMAADDTSAFNCRPVTGGSGWSEHSYGDAVDINPVENPYVTGATVLPAAGRAYLQRPDDPGVIHPDGAAVRAFAAIGWLWGGSWRDPVDLQHFSKTGR